MISDRRDPRFQIVSADDHGSEPRVLCGRRRYRLRQGHRYISLDSNRMSSPATFTSDADNALVFATAAEAMAYIRHVDPIYPTDEDGNINRPLANLNLVVEEVAE